jgi:hypothetical protein
MRGSSSRSADVVWPIVRQGTSNAALAAALPLLEQAARDAIAGRVQVRPVDLPSRLWSHPTIWTYLVNALGRGVL